MATHVLEHPTVSRRHAAMINHKDGSVYIVDMGSNNGTFVNGASIAPWSLILLKGVDICTFVGKYLQMVLLSRLGSQQESIFCMIVGAVSQ